MLTPAPDISSNKLQEEKMDKIKIFDKLGFTNKLVFLVREIVVIFSQKIKLNESVNFTDLLKIE